MQILKHIISLMDRIRSSVEYSIGSGLLLVIFHKLKWHDYCNSPLAAVSYRTEVFRSVYTRQNQIMLNNTQSNIYFCFYLPLSSSLLFILSIFYIFHSQELNPKFQITSAPTFANLPTAHTWYIIIKIFHWNSLILIFFLKPFFILYRQF